MNHNEDIPPPQYTKDDNTRISENAMPIGFAGGFTMPQAPQHNSALPTSASNTPLPYPPTPNGNSGQVSTTTPLQDSNTSQTVDSQKNLAPMTYPQSESFPPNNTSQNNLPYPLMSQYNNQSPPGPNYNQGYPPAPQMQSYPPQAYHQGPPNSSGCPSHQPENLQRAGPRVVPITAGPPDTGDCCLGCLAACCFCCALDMLF